VKVKDRFNFVVFRFYVASRSHKSFPWYRFTWF